MIVRAPVPGRLEVQVVDMAHTRGYIASRPDALNDPSAPEVELW